jgi:hypothetical protein
MAKTLLNGVQELLEKAAAIDSGSTLTSLTDDSRQTYIDLAVQSLNETVDELYSLGDASKPNQMKEATITLVQNQRSYVLRSDLLLLREEYPLVDETNTHHIIILGEDGYRDIIHSDTEQDDTGQPQFCAISPVNGRLVLDVLPDSTAAGRIYKYRYDRELELTAAGDTFPFSDTAYRAVVVAATELWRFYRHKEFNESVFRLSLGRAARYMRKLPKRSTWGPRRAGKNPTDPMSE